MAFEKERFDAYVYMTICESSIERWGKTKFSTYVNYCRNMKLCLSTGSLDKREREDIDKIVRDLVTIYDFELNIAANYVVDYFNLECHFEIQKYIKTVRSCYPTSFG